MSELADEIHAQAIVNQKNLEAYFDKGALPPITTKYSTLMPDMAQSGNKTTMSLIPAPDNKKGKFSYTEFVDQALISSLNNNIVDVKNPQAYPLSPNTLVRTSVSGVISHKIKNLLGTNPNSFSGSSKIIQSTYQQKAMENSAGFKKVAPFGIIEETTKSPAIFNLTARRKQNSMNRDLP